MLNISNIYNLYLDGFRNMQLGRTLWLIIVIKLAVILIFLNYFIHDRSFKSEYTTQDQRVDFVYNNLIGEK